MQPEDKERMLWEYATDRERLQEDLSKHPQFREYFLSLCAWGYTGFTEFAEETVFFVSPLYKGDPLEVRKGGTYKVKEVKDPEQKMHDIAKGVEIMHQKGYRGWDAKLGNVLDSFGDDVNCKLIDLETLAQDKWQVHGYSPRYAAPEAMENGVTITNGVSSSSDVYALGCCYLYLLTGEATANLELVDAGNKRGHQKRLEGILNKSRVPGPRREIIQSTMNYSPERRPTSAQVVKSIEAMMEEREVKLERHPNVTGRLSIPHLACQ